MPRKTKGWSDITVTDQFCGAGGSSLGAHAAGLRVRMAMNHWKLAVETHNTNFPTTDHDCCDISAADPRRYPTTDILITSPECTTHSPAGGNRRGVKAQRDIFLPTAEDPDAERSRATMRDVPRFAEYHNYRRIIVENVVEVTRWPLFHHWLQEMMLLGYQWKLVSHNSMFSWPTPQSRDRLYIVFWKKGDHAPDMAVTPQAPCYACEKVVRAVQTWKPKALKRAIAGQPFGKYRTQYVYSCPKCRTEVTPFYYAALNAIDFSLPATRIGDRAGLGLRPLAPRTIERIRYGLEKYGQRHLVVNVKQGERDSSRAWPADLRPMGAIPTWDGYFGVSSPFVVNTRGDGEPSERVSGLFDAAKAQTTRQEFALSFLAVLRRNTAPISMEKPIGTVTASGDHYALVGPGFAPFIAPNMENNTARGLDDAAPTCSTGNRLMLVQGAAQISLRDANAMRVAGLDAEMMAQGCAPQQALIQNAPFITSQYSGGGKYAPIEGPAPTMPASEVHELVAPARGRTIKVEDSYFRMLEPHEIGRAMAFRDDYKVLGNKRERVKQYGNAVTPPAMTMLITRQVQALTGERYE